MVPNFRILMLNPDREEGLPADPTTAFNDPALEGQSAMVELAVRLWMSGVPRGACGGGEIVDETSLFCVVEKIEELPDGSVCVWLRLIMDHRQDDKSWRKGTRT